MELKDTEELIDDQFREKNEQINIEDYNHRRKYLKFFTFFNQKLLNYALLIFMFSILVALLICDIIIFFGYNKSLLYCNGELLLLIICKIYFIKSFKFYYFYNNFS
jgi:hypothetical protein